MLILGSIPPALGSPPDCPCCGAPAGGDHRSGCNYLGAIRAQEYPVPIDDNGRAWYVNVIERLNARIAELEGRR